MLLNSVVIILREVLEAALLISLFLIFSHLLNISRSWLIRGVVLGMCSALIYAYHTEPISQWLDGAGQELTNAALELCVAVLLLVFNTRIIFHRQGAKKNPALTYSLLMFCVILVITREGSEMLLYLYGFTYVPRQFELALIGSVIGAGIGLSISIILYYLLGNLPTSLLAPTGVVIMTLISGGMVSQATKEFIQADILPSQQPLWDSSSWLAEDSVTGQLLYALIGYEATPGLIQVLFYSSSLIIMALVVTVVLWRGNATDSQKKC
ncbi:MAG: iron permease [Gammaproteobacteria bacterium HGW-Gammaproteobacteria-3]|jgi:high-affinity iron transporter|nr:MAG: iron permease [Gammaproteobacteria bacterium HGW-Gammaproteobacteria-3]